MKSFTLYTPTRIFFGEDADSNIGPALSSYGFKKVMIHYGSNRVVNNDLMKKVTDQLDQAGIAYCELGGVEPNPKITLVRKGVEFAREQQVDFILGIGGGSVCDSSKAIALGLATGMDPWDVISNGVKPEKPFPVGVVLTMAAAGSEMSNSCVITNSELSLKRSTNQDANRMLVAFMNPRNTITVPPFQTAAGSVDMMMHTMERYLTDEPATPLTDGIAVSLLRTVREQTELVVKDPSNVEARGELMWASSLAHNCLTGCGRNMTFTVHKLEHDFSGFKDSITHGAGLAVLFPAWVLHEYKHGIDRFYTWARDVWDADPDGTAATDEQKEQAILAGVSNLKKTYSSWGMPSTLADLGISPSDYETVANLTTNNGTKTIPSFGRQIGKEEILEIYKLAE